MKHTLILAAAVAVTGALAFVSSPADANPFQIGVCANPCVLGGDPNPIDPAGFNFQVQGSHTITNPLLAFVAEPNVGGVVSSAPSLSLPNATFTAVNGTNYGITTSNGLTGTAVLANYNGNDAYGSLGLANADNSEKYTNWLAGGGFTAAQVPSYTVYAVAVNIAGGTWSDTEGLFDLHDASVGSIVFAYGCTTVTLGVCSQGDNTGSTPFTNAGVLAVPAPLIGHGLFTLLCIGTILVGQRVFRRRDNGAAA